MTTNKKKVFALAVNPEDNLLKLEDVDDTELKIITPSEVEVAEEDEEEEDEEESEFIAIVNEIMKQEPEKVNIFVAVVRLGAFYTANSERINKNKYFLNSAEGEGYDLAVLTSEGEAILRDEIYFGIFDYIIKYMTKEWLLQ